MRMQITHPELGAVSYRTVELGPWPDLQVAGTVDVLKDRAVEDAKDPSFNMRAVGLAGGGGELDKVAALYNHTKHSIRFQRDEPLAQGLSSVLNPDEVVEVIIRPVDMAGYVDQRKGTGDCDDFSMYLAALLLANNIPCSFCTVAADGKAPDQYSHIYVVAFPDDGTGHRVRVACDSSHGEYVGWEVPNVFGKLREWPVTGSFCGLGWFGTLAASFAGIMAGWWLFKVWKGEAA